MRYIRLKGNTTEYLAYGAVEPGGLGDYGTDTEEVEGDPRELGLTFAPKLSPVQEIQKLLQDADEGDPNNTIQNKFESLIVTGGYYLERGNITMLLDKLKKAEALTLSAKEKNIMRKIKAILGVLQ